MRIELAVWGKFITQKDSIVVELNLFQFWITVAPSKACIVKESTVVKRNFDSYQPPPIEAAAWVVVTKAEFVKSMRKFSVVEVVIRFPWLSRASKITSM